MSFGEESTFGREPVARDGRPASSGRKLPDVRDERGVGDHYTGGRPKALGKLSEETAHDVLQLDRRRVSVKKLESLVAVHHRNRSATGVERQCRKSNG